MNSLCGECKVKNWVNLEKFTSAKIISMVQYHEGIL